MVSKTFENRDPSAHWTFFDPVPPRFAQRKIWDSSPIFLRQNRGAVPFFRKGAPLRGQGAPENLQCALPGSDFHVIGAFSGAANGQ
jgi:hypothetical protein